MKDAFIYDIVRTPRGMGHHGGALHEIKTVDLLAAALAALCQRSGIQSDLVEDIILGCVQPDDDQGFNLATAAALATAWPGNISGLQLSRHAASGLEAINLAATKIRSGWGNTFIAGGVESMSRVRKSEHESPLWQDPELLAGGSAIPPGISADLIATQEGFTREALDAWAARSRRQALLAWENGWFGKSIIPIYDRNQLGILDRDEFLLAPAIDEEACKHLDPAFSNLGTQGFDSMALHRFPEIESIHHLHTQANSSFSADGAALALLGNGAVDDKGKKLHPRAKIIGLANVCEDPMQGAAAAAKAAKKALHLAGLQASAIDLWECAELYAADALKFQLDMGIDTDKLNVNGGAIATGCPLGAHSAMLLSALIDELERRGQNRGVVAVYTHDGMGVATVIECC